MGRRIIYQREIDYSGYQQPEKNSKEVEGPLMAIAAIIFLLVVLAMGGANTSSLQDNREYEDRSSPTMQELAEIGRRVREGRGTPGSTSREVIEEMRNAPQRQERATNSPDVIIEIEKRYGSFNSLLMRIQSAESDVESIKRAIASLRQEQQEYYSRRAFGGASRLRQWKSRYSHLREELRTAESRLATLKREQRQWIRNRHSSSREEQRI